jgi:glycine oxidase
MVVTVTGNTDVVVVGAGVVGLSVAWRAARDGLSVAVCDPDPARGASWAAAGILSPATEARWGEAALLRLAQASVAEWPAFAAELEDDSGTDLGLRQDGTIAVAFDEDDFRALVDAVDVQRQLGCPADLLTSRECRLLEPALNPRAVGGALYSGDHQVDNRALLRALVAALERRGVRVRRSAVKELTTSAAGRATGVVLDDGSAVGAGTVVLAAGSRSGEIVGIPPADVPPVRPVKGQILRLQAGPGSRVLGRTVRALVQGRPVYLVPRGNGEIVVGATMEERGFDITVTVGAVHDLLRSAVAVVPDIVELELREALARLRPASPDNGPVLGAATTQGLVIATGHFRHGILLAPVTVGAIGEVLAGRPLPGPAASFSAQRFGVKETVCD